MIVPKIPLKAMKAKEVPFHKLEFPLLAQLKYDGVRLITTVRNGIAMFRTYNGSIVPLPRLAERFKHIDDVMLDGEIITQGGKNGTRTTVSGMINSAMHGGSINEDKLELACFDSMPLTEFNNRYCTQRYSFRYGIVTNIAVQTGISIARNSLVRSIEGLIELRDIVYADGYEGLILKPINHTYVFGRSNQWIKIKETKTCDLKCIDWIEGKGKYEGMIGALHCVGTVEGKSIAVSAGSGMTDADRALPFDFYKDKTIELKYNTVIRDSVTGNWSLFLPRFVIVRIDK